MNFIGRTSELNRLKKEFASEEMQMTLIYGRRRVGKSWLVKQAIKESGIRSIYYECKQVAETSNVQGYIRAISLYEDTCLYSRNIIKIFKN